MKKAKLINKIIPINNLYEYERLYIGNDYCEKNWDANTIIKLINFYKSKKITLLLPFFTDTGLKKLAIILKYLKENRLKNLEIVFNDWGTFYYLRKYYPKINLILGRLLTKQRKDPRMDIILKNKQEHFKIFKNTDYFFVYTKPVPSSLFELFSKNIIETPEIIKFLLENNVSRIEIDNLVWNMQSNLSKNIKVSMYYPYMILNVTRYCGAINNKYEIVCNKDCLKKSKNISENVFIKGNAMYYKNVVMPSKKILKINNIDRIIYQEI